MEGQFRYQDDDVALIVTPTHDNLLTVTISVTAIAIDIVLPFNEMRKLRDYLIRETSR